jgi:hypothetical protein
MSSSINGSDALVGGIEGELGALLNTLLQELGKAAVAAIVALMRTSFDLAYPPSPSPGTCSIFPPTGRTSPRPPARAGAVRRVSGPIPSPACADAFAPRRLRVPDPTPSTRQESEVGNTTALLHE